MSPQRRTRYVTQADIAAEAGVSRPLVSLVLRGAPNVSDEKRERVLAAARRLGYIESRLATDLAGNRSNLLIGYLPQSFGNRVFLDVYEGIASVLQPAGHHVLVMEGSVDPEQEDRNLRELVSFRPDAVILAGYSGSTDTLRAASTTIPFVSVTREMKERNVISVLGDDAAGTRAAVEHLIAAGHIHITHLELPDAMPYETRARTYAETMRAAGLTPHIVPTDITTEGGYRATCGLLDDGYRPSALFCGSDALALGAWDALTERHLAIPDDIALVGYDNTDIVRRLDITSVDQHTHTQGKIAAEAVLAACTGDTPPPEVQLVQPNLIERASSTSVHHHV